MKGAGLGVERGTSAEARATAQAGEDSVGTLAYIPTSFPRDPEFVNSVPEHFILAQVLEPLVRLDAQGHPRTGVAKGWDVWEDGLTWVFHPTSGSSERSGWSRCGNQRDPRGFLGPDILLCL
jgi:ABC-type oligopeptide transport system substrate-binding subunit